MGSDVVFDSLYLDRTDSVVFGLPGLFMDPHDLHDHYHFGCSLRRGHDRYLHGAPRSIQLGPHFSTLGCHHASPSGSVTCSMMDDFMSFVLRTCRAPDAILGHISEPLLSLSARSYSLIAVLGRSYVECLDPHVTISPWRRSFSHRLVIAFVTQPRDIVFASLTIILELFIEISSQWSVD
ncbi:hypothetical protein AAG906_011168 [Vitis piasezkii]